MPSEQLLQHRLPAGRRLRRGKIPFQPCSPTHRWGFAPSGSFAAEKHRARDQVWSRRDGFMSFTWQKETPWWVPVPCSLPGAEGRAGHGSTSSSPGFWHSQVVLNQLIPASLFDAILFHPPGAMIPPCSQPHWELRATNSHRSLLILSFQSLPSPELFLELICR